VEISDAHEVRHVLADPVFIVPPVPQVESPVGIAWLRSHVGRFSSGAEHERRRALAVAEIDRLEPDELRRDARQRAAAAVRDGEPLRHVPVETLAAALGLPAGLAADVATAASAYQPHVEADVDAADSAVARLVEACGGIADEVTAARIGLLVQACDATAGLVERALAATPDRSGATVEEILTGVLREDPPVRATRRLATAPARVDSVEVAPGTIVTLDLTVGGDDRLPFGFGLRPCPAREHALTIAAGIVGAVRDRPPERSQVWLRVPPEPSRKAAGSARPRRACAWNRCAAYLPAALS
jgi:cytochrome P450